jgi:hypothetical protein
MESKQYYKVRYAGKDICNISAHSKWEAIDRVFYDNISRYPWIVRQKLTAVLTR